MSYESKAFITQYGMLVYALIPYLDFIDGELDTRAIYDRYLFISALSVFRLMVSMHALTMILTMTVTMTLTNV